MGYPPRDITSPPDGIIDEESVWTKILFERLDPPEMICPMDSGNFPEADKNGVTQWGTLPVSKFYHSYVLNQHLANYRVKATAQGKQINWRSQSEVILMGEKYLTEWDYFMEPPKTTDGVGDFDRLIDLYKHGMKREEGADGKNRAGPTSNYLYLDGHVDAEIPKVAQTAFDPWQP
jgi:prepilin-type processing-associated H-X9-DG protein